jgi:hypothetical protein
MLRLPGWLLLLSERGDLNSRESQKGIASRRLLWTSPLYGGIAQRSVQPQDAFSSANLCQVASRFPS